MCTWCGGWGGMIWWYELILPFFTESQIAGFKRDSEQSFAGATREKNSLFQPLETAF